MNPRQSFPFYMAVDPNDLTPPGAYAYNLDIIEMTDPNERLLQMQKQEQQISRVRLATAAFVIGGALAGWVSAGIMIAMAMGVLP